MNNVPDKRFFRRPDRAAFWIGTLVSFLVYFFTCAPSVTLEDCGELAVAGDYMGVPHPPGYPSWTVCAWFFARLLSWVTFRGQPNPAWAIAVMSAFWGALATGIAAMLVSRSAADLLAFRRFAASGSRVPAPSGEPEGTVAASADDARFGSLASWTAGTASALVFAFSPVMWSQSVIVEVYSFNAFFLMLLLVLVYRWMSRPSARLLVLTAFVFGFGITNYQVILFLVVPLVLVILLQDVALFRDFALVGVPAAVLALCMSLGSKTGLPGFEKHVPLSPTGLAAESSVPFVACNPAEEFPVGGTPNAFQGDWIKIRTPFGIPSASLDPDTGLPRGDYETDAKGAPRMARTADGRTVLVPRYYYTYYPETTDADALWAALRRDVRADAKRAGRGDLDGMALDAIVQSYVNAGRLESHDSLRAKLSTAENGRAAGAVRATRLVAAAAMLFALLFAGAAVVLGRRARRGEAGPLPVPALAVLAVSGVALAVVCFAVLPGAPPTPAEALPRDMPTFSWLLPGAGLALLFAALWVLPLFTPGGLWYSAAASGVLVPVAVFVRKGALLGLTHPLNPCFAVYVAAGAALLAIAALLLENGRLVVLATAAAAVGVSGYFLMPVLGDSCPPMNWGYPRTWEGFKHAITRGQYEALSMAAPFTGEFVHKVAFFLKDVRAQFTMLLAPFALVPFAALRLRAAGGRRAVDLLPAVSVAAAATAAFAALDRLLGFVDFSSWRLPPDKVLFAVLGLVALVGLHVAFVRTFLPLFRRAADPGEPPSVRLVAGLAGTAMAVACFAIVLGFVRGFAEFALAAQWDVVSPGPALPETDPGFAARAAARGVFLRKLWALAVALYALWAAGVAFLSRELWLRDRDAAGDPPAVDAAQPPSFSRWLSVTVVSFLMMSVMVIAWASVKGDIQDNFIQKVKFISSHGIYSLWIGYGIALALLWGRGWARRNVPRGAAALVALAVAAVLATPLLPVNENYHNFRLVNETSAADQNGHDFGWQFGNYQLRGAPAITEELSEDEEPLPDPTYPRPMGPDAVFFGGTDPGRFVPTYMIYSAMVRPDVYLITQNALADSTYLDTMRGISREGEGVQGVYSDQIWMPTIEDNRRAFQRYTDDVQSGRRPDIGGITRTPDGRVSVNGALAVMQINAIIAEDIFLHNRDKHDFYVEESYPMDWMYRYITPNGLIMKVNRDEFWKEGARPVPYPAAVANADMDFWDWYSRRLVDDPKYGRDMPARKAFNKLRSAIAGTYVQRGDRVRAERAYNQALSLYVMSPETLRGLVINVDLALNRTQGVVERLDQLLSLDPNNDGVRSMRKEVARIVDAMRDLRELGPRIAYSPAAATPEMRLRVVEAALVLGNPQAAAQALLGPDGESALGPADLFRAAALLADHGQAALASKAFARVPDAFLSSDAPSPDDLLKAYEAHLAAKDYGVATRTLALYLPRRRDDWEKWIEFAVLSAQQGRAAAARAAVQNAVAAGGDAARKALRAYPSLLELAPPAGSTGASPLLPSAR